MKGEEERGDACLAFGLPSRAASGLGSSVAAPDAVWDDADHRPTQANEDDVIDPWHQRLDMASVRRALEPRIAEGLIVDPNQVRRARVDTNVETEEHPSGPGAISPNPTSTRFGEDGGARCATDPEERETLEDIEIELIETHRQLHDFAGEPLLSENSAPAERDNIACSLSEIEEELSDADVPIPWPENKDETLEADWEEQPNWKDDFEAFVGPDHTNLGDDLGLYDYDDEARQSPWDIEADDDETAIRRARGKAAAITSLLDLRSVRERDAALHFLTTLFEELRHASTYRALHRLAADGLDFATLQTLVALRRVWLQRPDWWLYRYQGEVCFHKHGAATLTWILAHRVCLARWECYAENMISEEWLDEWLTLPAGYAGYFSFPEFIAEKVDSLDAEILYTGLLMKERSGSPRDLSEEYDWHRRVPDRYGVLEHGFRILTPYDDRTGPIRPDQFDNLREQR